MRQCPKCGTQVSEGGQFCPQCGFAMAGVLDGEQTLKQDSAAATGQKDGLGAARGKRSPVKKSSKIALFTAILLILVAGGAAASYMLMNKTPKQRFMEAQLHYLAKLTQEVDSDYAALDEVEKRMLEETSVNTLDITGSLRNASALGEEAVWFNDLLARSNFVLTSKDDPKNQVTSAKAQWKVAGSDLVSAEFWESESNLALHIPALHPKHLILENRNLGQFFRSLGIDDYNGPNSFSTRNDAQEVLTKYDKELTGILVDYGKFFVEFIEDEEVTLDKDVSYTSPEGTVEVDRLTLTLSEERLQELVRATAQRFQNDDKALDVLSEVIAGLVRGSLETSGVWDPMEVQELKSWQDPAFVRSELKRRASTAADSAKDIQFSKGLKFAILVDGKEIVQQNIDFTVEDLETSLELKDWTYTNSSTVQEMRLHLSRVGSSGGDWLGVETKTQTGSAAENQKSISTEFQFDFYESGQNLVTISGSVDTVIEKEASPGKTRYTYDVYLHPTGLEFQDVPDFKGHLVILADSKLKNDTFVSEGTFDLTIEPKSSLDPRFGVDMKFKSTIELSQAPIPVPDTTSSNSIRLNELTPEEIEALIEEAAINGFEFLESNAHLFE